MGMQGGDIMRMMSSGLVIAGLDHKAVMRMHGEMMRAIGDILIKYADKMEPAAKQ